MAGERGLFHVLFGDRYLPKPAVPIQGAENSRLSEASNGIIPSRERVGVCDCNCVELTNVDPETY